jgi:hypothetical protein
MENDDNGGRHEDHGSRLDGHAAERVTARRSARLHVRRRRSYEQFRERLASVWARNRPLAEEPEVCLPVGQSFLDRIATRPAGSAIHLDSGFALRPSDYSGGYLIAGHLTGRRLAANDVGVWVSESRRVEDAKPVLAVDGFAKRYTTWPDAAESGLGVDHFLIDAAKACTGAE